MVHLHAEAANSPLVYTVALVVGGLWGAIFLHLGVSFPTGRLTAGMARTLAIAGYFVFPLAFVPALFFASPHDLGCDDCPTNLLLVRHDHDLATVCTGLGALLYLVLFASCSLARSAAGGRRRPSTACSSRRSTSSPC